MKKLTALAAGVLLLSSSVFVGCGYNAADDNGANTYDATRGGRVMGTDNNNRVGIHTTPVRDEDRLGTLDDIGPDNVNLAGEGRENRGLNGMRGLGIGGGAGAGAGLTGRDQDRLGVNDNFGPDWGRNLRNDATLESRVEAIPGVRDAKVLVSGNTAYVALNTGQRTFGTNNNGNLLDRGGNNNNAGVNGTNGTRTVRGYGDTAFGAGNTNNQVGRRGNSVMGTGLGNVGNGNGNGNMTNAGGAGNAGVYADDFVSADMKGRVASAIRQANRGIQNVYVSANPAALNRMNAFVRDTGAGNPVRGANDLGDMFRRMFPAAR